MTHVPWEKGLMLIKPFLKHLPSSATVSYMHRLIPFVVKAPLVTFYYL